MDDRVVGAVRIVREVAGVDTELGGRDGEGAEEEA